MVFLILYLTNESFDVLGVCYICWDADRLPLNALQLVELINSLPNSLSSIPFSSGDDYLLRTSEEESSCCMESKPSRT